MHTFTASHLIRNTRTETHTHAHIHKHKHTQNLLIIFYKKKSSWTWGGPNNIIILNLMEFKILMHTYNTLHWQAPWYILDMLTVCQQKRTIRSIISVTLAVPRARTSNYDEIYFQCTAVKVWSAPVAHIRESNILLRYWKLICYGSIFGA